MPFLLTPRGWGRGITSSRLAGPSSKISKNPKQKKDGHWDLHHQCSLKIFFASVLGQIPTFILGRNIHVYAHVHAHVFTMRSCMEKHVYVQVSIHARVCGAAIAQVHLPVHAHACLRVRRRQRTAHKWVFSLLHAGLGIEPMSSILSCSPTWLGTHGTQAALNFVILLLLPPALELQTQTTTLASLPSFIKWAVHQWFYWRWHVCS